MPAFKHRPLHEESLQAKTFPVSFNMGNYLKQDPHHVCCQHSQINGSMHGCPAFRASKPPWWGSALPLWLSAWRMLCHMKYRAQRINQSTERQEGRAWLQAGLTSTSRFTGLFHSCLTPFRAPSCSVGFVRRSPASNQRETAILNLNFEHSRLDLQTHAALLAAHERQESDLWRVRIVEVALAFGLPSRHGDADGSGFGRECCVRPHG